MANYPAPGDTRIARLLPPLPSTPEPSPVNVDCAHQANISLEPSFSAVCRKRVDALSRPVYDAVIDTRY
ncbi:hypothetical protein [Undibacterium sp. RuTC16W]|uniref:hypothetical protein n=1 Tax=Undibacterium sp. RuTC16W TaxID=3413048 RepID=UPI003BF27D24